MENINSTFMKGCCENYSDKDQYFKLSMTGTFRLFKNLRMVLGLKQDFEQHISDQEIVTITLLDGDTALKHVVPHDDALSMMRVMSSTPLFLLLSLVMVPLIGWMILGLIGSLASFGVADFGAGTGLWFVQWVVSLFGYTVAGINPFLGSSINIAWDALALIAAVGVFSDITSMFMARREIDIIDAAIEHHNTNISRLNYSLSTLTPNATSLDDVSQRVHEEMKSHHNAAMLLRSSDTIRFKLVKVLTGAYLTYQEMQEIAKPLHDALLVEAITYVLGSDLNDTVNRYADALRQLKPDTDTYASMYNELCMLLQDSRNTGIDTMLHVVTVLNASPDTINRVNAVREENASASDDTIDDHWEQTLWSLYEIEPPTAVS